MNYNITLPPFSPHQVHKAASVYTNLNLHHRWLLDALNKGTYPEFMEVDAEGMVTNYSRNREPAISMVIRETLNVARDYCNLLIREREQLAMYDYIATVTAVGAGPIIYKPDNNRG